MPYARSKNKNKREKTKRKTKENVKLKNLMRGRLMAIRLKADNYIYKRKPISIQDAAMYARELEAFGKQSQDERYLQTIEKLIVYMKYIIKEQSPEDIADIAMNTIENSSEGLNNKIQHAQNAAAPENNVIIDIEKELSLSNLSITDTNDNNIPQRNSKKYNSTSVAKENFKEVINHFSDINNGIENHNTHPSQHDGHIQNSVAIPTMIQRDIAAINPSDNQVIIEKVKKQRKTKKQDIAKTRKKRSYDRKNKVNKVADEKNDLSKAKVHSSVADAMNIENSVGNLDKGKRNLDMSWVEKIKFVRIIEIDEYVNCDNLKESFWNDATLPSNMNLTDFEDENINVWKI